MRTIITVNTESFSVEEVKSSMLVLAGLLPPEEQTRVAHAILESLRQQEEKSKQPRQSHAEGGGSFMGEAVGF